MNDFEHTPHEPEQNPIPEDAGLPQPDAQGPGSPRTGLRPGGGDLASEAWDSAAPSDKPSNLFQSWSQPVPVSAARVPNLAHLCLLAAFTIVGVVCAMALMMTALHFHLFGVSNLDQVKTNVHYLLGFEAVVYLVALLLGIFIFPLFWNKSLFAGIQWRGVTVFQLGWRLPATALGCFALAALDEVLLPGPPNAPIDDIFRSPGAAWLMFAFGVTFAPFFEETAFRGFMLPAFATAWDWAIERSTGKPARPLDAQGHPQWSAFAMIIASIVTSLIFAQMHAEQQGHSLGPFLLLIVISLVLCAVRLKTRSLAASTLVHACYNFLLFFFMLLGTGGFRHLERM